MFQVLNSHRWLVATLLENMNVVNNSQRIMYRDLMGSRELIFMEQQLCGSHWAGNFTMSRNLLIPIILPHRYHHPSPWRGKLRGLFYPTVCFIQPPLCEPMDRALPGSSIHRILQARTLECVAISSSRGSSWPRDRTRVSYVSCIVRRILYHQWHLGSPRHLINSQFLLNHFSPVVQSCPTLCDPIDCSTPGFHH